MTPFTLPRDNQTDSTSSERGFGALRTSAGNLPLKQLTYQTRMIGLAVRTTVAQTFYNPFDECIEATFIFPLEAEQAVTRCEMWVADRVIHATLKERGEARAEYARAIRRGHRAALLEENRPETFSMKVGNIPPGEAVQVRFQTVGQLPVVDGEWTLRMPLVVAPRYTSGFGLPRSSVGPGTATDTTQVPDASTVTPPTWLPGFSSPVDLRLRVDLHLGDLVESSDWFHQLRSSLHAVLVQSRPESATAAGAPGGCRVEVHPGERVDRDFILRGSLARTAPRATLAVERTAASDHDDEQSRSGASPSDAHSVPDDYATFGVQITAPPVKHRLPRDVVFVLDRSGSMTGWKIAAARRGICRLVDSLTDEDRLVTIAFDDRIESPSSGRRNHSNRWLSATDSNRFDATRWLGGIEARGGTEMGQALHSALGMFQPDAWSDDLDGNAHESRSAAIVLVTDGQITAEDAVLQLLGTIPAAQRPRLYCLGIDRAVNASVLKRLAAQTGGTFELVESEQRLDEVLQRFGDELGAPALTDLKIVADEHRELHLAPRCSRTLYAGRTVSIYGRVPGGGDLTLTVRGRLPNGEDWSDRVAASPATLSPGDEPTLLPIWGRARVRELEDTLAAGRGRSELRQAIIRCSLDCNVLSRFTAFVAVDESERVNERRRPHPVTQPVELPEGWQPAALPPLDRESLLPIRRRHRPAIFGCSKLDSSIGEALVHRGVISREQLRHAKLFAEQSSHVLSNALVALSYATSEEVAEAVADSRRLPYVDLTQVRIPLEIIELLPESVARENLVLPYAATGNELTIVTASPDDQEVIDKLQFILNRGIRLMVASPTAIEAAIVEHYAQVEGESVDSMIQEFADTAIDFAACAAVEPEFQHRSPRRKYAAQSMTTDCDVDFEMEEMELSSPPAAQPPRDTGKFRKLSRRPRTRQPQTAPIEDLVERIFAAAAQRNASHVIIQIRRKAVDVVLVVDGNEEVLELPIRPSMRNALRSRLMILAKVDVAVRDRLQSGNCPNPGDNSRTVNMHFAPLTDGLTVLIELAKQPDDPTAVTAWWKQVSVGS